MFGGASAILFMALTASLPPLERVDLPDRSAAYYDEAKGLGLVQVAIDDPITVPIVPVAGAPDAPINLNLKPPLDGLRFVIFKTIAPDIKFSQGFRMRDAWIVSMSDLEKLQVIVPPGFAGSLIFDASFHRTQTVVAARGVVVVNINSPSPATSVPPTAANPAEPQQHPVQPMVGTLAGQERNAGAGTKKKGVPPDEEKEELARGARLVSIGDVATARLIYQNLAIRGSALGARALGETYDPTYLKVVAPAGLQPDVAAARKW